MKNCVNKSFFCKKMENINDFNNLQIPNYREEDLFDVPQHYFDDLPDKVMARLQVEEKALAFKKKRRRLLYTVSSVAASLLIVFTVAFFTYSEKLDKKTDSLACLNYDDLSVVDYQMLDYYDECLEMENEIETDWDF